MITLQTLVRKAAYLILALAIIPLTILASVASAEMTIQGASYGKVQTLVIPGSRCYTKGPTNLTAAVSEYCRQNTNGNTCVYTVPWATPLIFDDKPQG